MAPARKGRSRTAAAAAAGARAIIEVPNSRPSATVLSAEGQAEKMVLKGGKAARLGSAPKMGIGGLNRRATGAAKPAATYRSGQSLLPAGVAKLTPAAMGRARLFPMVKAGSKLTRSSRASRGVAKLSRVSVTKSSAVGMVTRTGARGVQNAPTGGTVGTGRSPRRSRLGR